MRRILFLLLTALFLMFSAHGIEAQTNTSVSIVPASPLTPDLNDFIYRLAPGLVQGLAEPFQTGQDLAFQGNGLAKPAVAKDNIPGWPDIHKPEFANDGYYGNGASWISNSSGSWVKIDLGRIALIDRITFGRDRIGNYNDRDPGQFTIEVALTDNVYANGDDSNDSSEYTEILDSGTLGFSGSIHYSQTVQASFPPAAARFIKLTVASHGACIDEFEVFGVINTPPDVLEAVPSVPTIWPPNNKMVDIEILGVTDPDTDPVTITITGITDDEGSDPDDVDGIGTSTAQVRAQRDGKGNGRIYTISFDASDAQATTPGSVTVSVPHDQGKGKAKGKAGKLIATTGPAVGGLLLGDNLDASGLGQRFQQMSGNPAFELAQNVRNPFNPATTIYYSLDKTTNVRLTIYNVLGQPVRTLVNGGQGSGRHSVVWDGRDAFGHPVTSGLYLYRLEAGPNVAVRKMVLAK